MDTRILSKEDEWVDGELLTDRYSWEGRDDM
jgi:hypothetical protein